MRIKTVVEDLSETEWDLIESTVNTAYDFGAGATRICVVFTRGELERHAEMPMGAFIGVLKALALSKVFRLMGTAVAALRPDSPMPSLVRPNCAFCGRERTAKDDNHAPDCAYWTIGPGSVQQGLDT